MRNDAVRALKKAVTYSCRGSLYLAELGYAYAATGRRGDALQILRELTKRGSRAIRFALCLRPGLHGHGKQRSSFRVVGQGIRGTG
jgi:hypothetical protein